MNKKGSALIHVLVLAVIVGVITAGVVRMVLMNTVVIQRLISGGQNRKEADALLSRATAYWNATNIVCSDIPGMRCVPASRVTPGVCRCRCTDASGARIEVAGGGPPPCTDVTITSSDPP